VRSIRVVSTAQQQEIDMFELFTKEQLVAKGFNKNDVKKMLKKCETKVNFYAKQYVANGNKCSESIEKAWNLECARFDHYKLTLSQF
jgi:hypothetical protein